MILIFDVGNSDVVAYLYDVNGGKDDNNNVWNGPWREVMRVRTDVTKQYFHWLFDVNYKISEYAERIDKIVYSSVVPELNEKLIKICKELFSICPIVVNYKLYANLPIAIPQPRIIGSDLVANAFAGYTRSPEGCIIADFGTVLTFTTVYNKEIQGVTFVPGLKTAMSSLVDKTAQLPRVTFEVPPSVIGKNTAQAINAGILYGYAGLVDRILSQIRKEVKVPLKVFSTGGLGDKLQEQCSVEFEYDRLLTADGLRLIAEYSNKNEESH
ncbi:MAG: type III pantothenate kinase [Bacteroidales bacterium]|nr:type III pantothenate kinase [Bacteroidales bacterium]